MPLAGGKGGADESSEGNNSGGERELHGKIGERYAEGSSRGGERGRARSMLLLAAKCPVFNLLPPSFCTVGRKQLPSDQAAPLHTTRTGTCSMKILVSSRADYDAQIQGTMLGSA